MYDFDLFVIGGGSGGIRTARMAAKYGAKVALAEERYMGGTCVNVGCVPKKLYAYAAHYHYDCEDSRQFGWLGPDPVFNWETLKENKKYEIARLNTIYASLLENAGIHKIEGSASLKDAHTVEVNGQSYTARHILLATGGWPQIPDIPGHELAITSNEIFDLAAFPERILVVGGGYIGVEFAGIFAGLGSQTTLCHRGDLPLKGFDEDIRQAFYQELEKHVALRMSTSVEQLRKEPDGSVRVNFSDQEEAVFDCVLFATGRKPNTEGLGLEKIGIETDERGHIPVNDDYQTTQPSVYALGDVISGLALTPVALAEGMRLAGLLFAEPAAALNYQNIPTAVFSHPNIATVGMTEAQARAQYKAELRIFRSNFRALKHTVSGRNERTYIKIIVSKADDRVLGIHMMGDGAGEIIQGFAAAMSCGLTKTQLDSTIGIHPTVAEELLTLREGQG